MAPMPLFWSGILSKTLNWDAVSALGEELSLISTG